MPVVGTVNTGYRYTRVAVHISMAVLAVYMDQQVVAGVVVRLNQLLVAGLGYAQWDELHRHRLLPHNLSRTFVPAPEGSHIGDRNGGMSAT